MIARVAAAGATALCVAWSALASQPGQQQIQVQTGVSVMPDTVRIGDPFTVIVAVRVPRGATIEFPAAPDTTKAVQALASRLVTDGPRSDSTFVEQQAAYRLAAWDLNAQVVLPEDVVVRMGSAERRISLREYTVFVETVLPTDSAERVPKPARPLYEQRAIPAWLWAALAAVAALALAWWYWRRRRSQRVVPVTVDPYRQAMQEFARIEALRLLEAGERGRYVALTVDVLRTYLSERFPSAPLSTTTTELLAATRDQKTVLQERLLRVLNEADLIKFARRSVPGDRANEIGKEACLIVESEHRSSAPVVESATSEPARRTGAAA